MRPSENIEKLVSRLQIELRAEVSKRNLDDALAAQKKATGIAHSKPTAWSIIMKSPITKIAAAAVIIMVIIGLHHLNISIRGTGVAWADVAERLEQMSSFTARSRRVGIEVGKKEPHIECEVFKYFSPGLGYMEKQYINYMDGQYMNGVLGMIGYGLFQEKVLIIVVPAFKQYYRFEINEEILSMMEYINPINPDGIMKLFGSERCTRLGKRRINNVDAEGFEVRDIKVFAWVPRILFKCESTDMRIWVDPRTLLPIEVEAESLVGKGFLTGFKDLAVKEVVYDIEYDAEIDESIFDPNIPDDYTLIDPANIAEKAEITMLGIVPCGTAMIIYKHIKKERNRIIRNR